MKQNASVIPKKLRADMNLEPFYHSCARREALHDHECAPNPITRRLIEWHHALKYAGKKVQKRYAIVPLCWWTHEGPGKDDAIGAWIALNRASDEEILELSHKGGRDYFQYRHFLNKKFGVYKVVETAGHSTGINYGFHGDRSVDMHSA